MIEFCEVLLMTSKNEWHASLPNERRGNLLLLDGCFRP